MSHLKLVTLVGLVVGGVEDEGPRRQDFHVGDCRSPLFRGRIAYALRKEADHLVVDVQHTLMPRVNTHWIKPLQQKATPSI